ncbi:30S ribosomal protein S11 [bacterium]|jgi:small subunit ribosomal protein S11|nr:30S ribosomal protein S11 [bacterium]NBO35955.1 30S ribosomal protein S11 [bacterium]
MNKTVKNKKTTKKAANKIIPAVGNVYISSGNNNTLMSITDEKGNVLYNGSTGMFGFKNSRQATPYAATKVAEETGLKAFNAGVKEVNVFVKGTGMGRINAIKALKVSGLKVLSITDTTPLPHNGCRPSKKRRV